LELKVGATHYTIYDKEYKINNVNDYIIELKSRRCKNGLKDNFYLHYGNSNNRAV